MSTPPPKVDYLGSARRHLHDADLLLQRQRRANAGQLFGFSVECGLKFVLTRAGVFVDRHGNIDKVTGYREHLPKLGQLVNALRVLPDGRSASQLQSYLPSLHLMQDWHTDHRYWKTSEIPLASSLGRWEQVAREVERLLDDVISQGIGVL